MKVLLIPTAVLISNEMRQKFGNIPTGLFPLQDRPMLSHIYEKYKDVVDEVYVITFEKSDQIKEYIQVKKLPIKFIHLDKLGDLGYTIRYGIKAIVDDSKIPIECVYINFADTLLNDELCKVSNDFAFYSVKRMDSKWTWFLDDNGQLRDILEKDSANAENASTKKYRKLFVGVFGISNVNLLLEELAIVDENSNIDSFYIALQQYSYKQQISFIPAKQWLDVGHNEMYNQAKTNVAAREFNTILIDKERGILTKKSKNTEKLINEISWYLRMPKQLQYLLPRVYEYSLDFTEPFVKMEYYGYRTLHEMLLYGDYSEAKWKSVFEKIRFLLNDMGTFKIAGRSENIKQSLWNVYIVKTKQRLEKLKNIEHFDMFFDNAIKVNGKTYWSLNEVLEMLPKYVKKYLINDGEKFFSIIHGDLCFTNILVEDSYDFLRLIDPRGNFGLFDIYGDSRYEIAKLCHSLEGKYDYIIEDMFEINVNGTDVYYKILKDNKKIWKIFREVFATQLENIQAVRLIEAILFFSMISLHNDSLTRQYAMLATAYQLLEKVVKIDDCR